MRLKLHFCAFFATIVWSDPTPAEDYLPLFLGNHWEYDSVGGNHENQDVEDTMTIWGHEVYVIRYHESTDNEGLENYWTTQSDGDVELWGYHRTLDGFGAVYDPPILLVDAPPYLGKTWSQEIDYYSYPGLVYTGTFEIGFEVYEEGWVSVPAGEFFAYGIGQALPPGIPLGVRLDGSVGDIQAAGEPWEWWSANVGQVQYGGNDLYQLSLYGLPTPIRTMSWGQIKVAIVY